MVYFETLLDLGSYADRSGLKIADPGVPLSDLAKPGAVWRRQPSIRKVVGFKARHLASTPLHLFRRKSDGSRVRVRNSPLAQLLAKPSPLPGVTAFSFWERWWIDRMVYDKAVCMMHELDDGQLELVPIPACYVELKGTVSGGITHVEMPRSPENLSDRVELPAEHFLISHGYSRNGVNGTSPMETLCQLLDEYRASLEYRSQVLENGARIPGVIERPAEAPAWTETARDRFAADWREFTADGAKAGSEPVLEEGMTYKALESFRPKDAQDLEGRRLTDEEVAQAFWVYPELLGIRTASFANMRELRQMLWGPVLGPDLDMWGQLLSRGLIEWAEPVSRGLYIEPNIEAKMRGSFEEQSQVMSTAVGGPWMTRGEARERMNLPKLEGTDELITPLNVTEGGKASPQDGT